MIDTTLVRNSLKTGIVDDSIIVKMCNELDRLYEIKKKKEGVVKVSIAVSIDEDGDYNAYGNSGTSNIDAMYESLNGHLKLKNPKSYFVIAYIPIPRINQIEADEVIE